MKKIILLVLTLLALCVIFTGCNGDDVGEQPDGTTTEAVENTETPKQIAIADLSKYEMIRPASASASLVNAFADLMAQIRSDFEINISARDDYFREGVASLAKGEFEILIGETNRDETVEFLSKLKRDEYGYKMINDKIVIAGHTDEGTIKALEDFSKMLKDGDRTEIFFDSETDEYVKTATYPLEDLKINGVSAFDYTFVYPYSNKNMEKELAKKLREKIADVCGAYPRIVDDKTEVTGEKIVIGNAALIGETEKNAYKSAMGSYEEGKYYTFVENGTVWVNAEDTFGFIGAVSEISSKIKDDTAELSLETGVNTAKAGAPISVMSFNIYTHTNDSTRNERVIKMIKERTPDVMGVQEASATWMNILKERITDTYDYVGVGRNGGNSGEYSAIFYNKNKFTVVESGTKWLSSTPDVAGSKVSSSSYPRIMTYAILERKSDGLRFLYVNTHLEHTNSESRVFQIDVLLKEIAKLPDLPTIVTGDFNCTSGEQTYKDMIKASFADAAESAKHTSDRNSATFHNYGESSRRIDYIFASAGDIYIDSYEVCDEKIDGNYASDHHPIIAEFSIVG